MKKIIITSCIIFISSKVDAQNISVKSSELKYENCNKSLDSIYKEILNKYANDTIFIDRVRSSQKFWVKYRDSEIEALYPSASSYSNGTVKGLCLLLKKTEMTNARINELNVFLNGYGEGNVCDPSVIDNYDLNH